MSQTLTHISQGITLAITVTREDQTKIIHLANLSSLILWLWSHPKVLLLLPHLLDLAADLRVAAVAVADLAVDLYVLTCQIVIIFDICWHALAYGVSR